MLKAKTRPRPAIRRARAGPEKAARREALLDALQTLFADAPYDKITVAAIARRCRLAKGTVYLYFPTRETMFLALYLRHAAAFAASLADLVEQVQAPEELAAAIAGDLARRPILLRLMALAPTVLERNIGEDVAASFKKALVACLGLPAEALEWNLPHLGKGGGLRFLLRLNALAVGFHEMANPSPAVAKALAADPALQPLRIDFRAELADALAEMLRGRE